MAKQMGVPIGMLCAGVNINGEINRIFESADSYKGYNRCLTDVCFRFAIDITHRAIQSGKFHKKKIEKTLSDAINIEVVRRI